MTGGAACTARASTRGLGWVTARSSTRSHRVTAHGPHSIGSSAAGRLHVPAGDTIVHIPSWTVTSLAVNLARCLYGSPASWERTSRARSRRPNIPAVQPCDGRPRSAAATCSGCAGVSGGAPVRRPSAARTTTDSPGLSCPEALWWWSIAATRRRRVAGAAAHPARKSTTVCGSAGSAGRSVTVQWSVNNAQSPAYAARVRPESTRAGSSVVISAAVVMAVRGRGG